MLLIVNNEITHSDKYYYSSKTHTHMHTQTYIKLHTGMHSLKETFSTP